VDTLVECLNTLRPSWVRAGRTREVQEWYALALNREAHLDPRLKEDALAISGELAYQAGRLDEALQFPQTTLSLGRARGAKKPLQHLHLGMVLLALGELSGARVQTQDAVAGFEERQHVGGIAAAVNNPGEIHRPLANHGEALGFNRKALQIKMDAGSDIETVLLNLGDLDRETGDLAAAQAHLIRALEGLVQRNFMALIPAALSLLGQLTLAQGRPDVTAVLLGAAASRQHISVDISMKILSSAR